MVFASPLPVRLAESSQTIYLMRHGETDMNARNIIQGGGVDSDLNDEGIRQAELFFQKYGHLSFTAIYASGLKRTRQTLAPFERAGHRINLHQGLNEMGWGILEGVAGNEKVRTIFEEMSTAWASGDLDQSVEGGESPREVSARVLSAFKEILLSHPEGDLLICTHGRVLRILLAELMGYGLERMQWFGHKNTAVNILTRLGDRFVADRLNDTSHLALPLAS